MGGRRLVRMDPPHFRKNSNYPISSTIAFLDCFSGRAIRNRGEQIPTKLFDPDRLSAYNAGMSSMIQGSTKQPLKPDTPVQFVKGIGPKRAEKLIAEGIRTLSDILDYPPFRYEDRTRFQPIRSLTDGDWALIRAEVCSSNDQVSSRRGMSIVTVLVRDSAGAIPLKFFNQPYLKNVYHTGMQLVIYGQVKRDTFAGGSLAILNPECEILDDDASESIHSGRIVPIYRKLGAMKTRTLRQILFRAVFSLPPEMDDPIPSEIRKQLHLLPRAETIRRIHFPEISAKSAEERDREMDALNLGLSPAHKRMVFEEFFQLQVGIQWVREGRIHLSKSHRYALGENVRLAIRRILPFHPTFSQKRVLKEIAEDMRSVRPMNRLLQGDVGSGKTIVAAQAAIIAAENGYQTALMAPTEILAEQHYLYFKRLMSPLGYGVDLLTGSLKTRQKKEVLVRLQSGESRIAIGTHALIQEGVQFKSLALAIVDEQHRFGVIQRGILRKKGGHPDVLVMTATPIPRSLSLTLYGDLDVSVIDEMPPGRKPIETLWYKETERHKAYQDMLRAVSAGHQVYVVYPLVEESEKTDLLDATSMATKLQSEIFPQFKVGLLHGKMKSAEKEEVMRAFASGEINILVSTTVIEVGVDVPNASLMVVEHAERFGLAQLHQLRGRVGRGKAQSRCILIGNAKGSEDARRRLEILCETNDGFRIAEVDLELRGPGEFIGTRQSGIPAFLYANLVRDRKALELAKVEAERFIAKLRQNPAPDVKKAAALIRERWQGRYGLAMVG
jgi:ATP-dependent DNA helicase RecG